MSTPGGFEYTDDSVVARLAFDIPAQALTDITQLTKAMSAMATEQEAIARTTGTWLDYLNQVPVIAERANQSMRETITTMERMAYIQNEMGGGLGNVGATPTAGPQGAYSTAAPSGYVNPFAGQFFGMGAIPQDVAAVQQQLSGIASQDPRLYANMMAARGQAVNPALLGMMGGAVAGFTGQGGVGDTGGGMGYGNAAPGSMSTQATQAARDSAAPPDPTQSGATTRSEPQNIPAEPHPDAPPWQRAVMGTVSAAQQIVNETQGATGRGGNNLLGLASAGLGAAGKFASNHPNALGGFGGRLGTVAKGAGLLGAGAWAFNKAQDVGETIQKYEQLGNVQGGDWGTGIKYEAQARMLALNPFITTQQARQAMQMALSEGFQGGEYDTVMDYMLNNFKDMGVQFATSMDYAKQAIYSGEDVGAATSMSADLMQAMKRLSAEGGQSFPDRVQTGLEMSSSLMSQGFSAESAYRAVLGAQEGYADNKVLRDSMGQLIPQATGSPQLMTMVANRMGVTGLLPGALEAGLDEAGFDGDELLLEAAKEIAHLVSGYPNKLNRIAAFRELMAQNGVQMDWRQAKALYEEATGEGPSPVERANERVANSNQEGRSFVDQAGDFLSNLARPFTTGLMGGLTKAVEGKWDEVWPTITENQYSTPHQADKDHQRDAFARAGRAPAELPQTAEQADTQAQTVRTEGQVSGEVRITVDQAGRVSAPQSIQLTGQQKSAYAGYGSSQLNNPPPGDHNASTGWGG
ncbi:tail length tape measure protein [Mycobacterium phage Tonenili]|uniref:Tape measure protein n=1 Tax=Mycobacterium phage Tonenili TaxID=1891703 RepID=A0A1C9EHC0_9CAUD|nr:tail length tape measure protein [Mycobacterium phage Tonenili]AON96892.1 tape measure protein [Mycobacterium phage Tonenili]